MALKAVGKPIIAKWSHWRNGSWPLLVKLWTSRLVFSYIQNPISALRTLHYPATANQAQAGQQRAGAHTDYGFLTILLPQAGTTGLQILHKDEWVNVPILEDYFVINISDLMALWTSQRWVSTLHRVIATPNQPSSQSLAFFHQPDWEAEIMPIFSQETSASVRSGPYLMKKFKNTNS